MSNKSLRRYFTLVKIRIILIKAVPGHIIVIKIVNQQQRRSRRRKKKKEEEKWKRERRWEGGDKVEQERNGEKVKTFKVLTVIVRL